MDRGMDRLPHNLINRLGYDVAGLERCDNSSCCNSDIGTPHLAILHLWRHHKQLQRLHKTVPPPQSEVRWGGAIGKLSKSINLSFSAKKITSHILVIL